jgi:hypothetical protein
LLANLEASRTAKSLNNNGWVKYKYKPVDSKLFRGRLRRAKKQQIIK